MISWLLAINGEWIWCLANPDFYLILDPSCFGINGSEYWSFLFVIGSFNSQMGYHSSPAMMANELMLVDRGSN